MHLAWSLPARLPGDSGNSGIPAGSGGKATSKSQTPSTPAFLQHQRSGPWSAAPSYLGIVCFCFCSRRTSNSGWSIWTQERLREVGNVEEGEARWPWGWTRKETQVMDCRGPRGGVGKPKKERDQAKGQCTRNMQMYKEGISTSLGVLTKERSTQPMSYRNC